MATREQNEEEFENWRDLPDGGRRYWNERKGKIWGYQHIIKIVDVNENTLFVIQEIYNHDGELFERHQKYPVDTGHEIINEWKDEDA